MSNSGSDSRRNLGECSNVKFDPVLVFCRIRPLQPPSENSNVFIKDETTATLVVPTTVQSPSSHKQSLEQATDYIFKQVFGPTTKQRDVYRTVAQPLVEKLIRGESSLLFTYGVTGSGKTYTMTGDCNDLGLMPRCLKALFHSIEGFHARKFIFQPNHTNGFEIISDSEALARKKVEKPQRSSAAAAPVQRTKTIDMEYKLSSLDDTPPVAGVDERNVYAVFISYTEIYNNCVYDLLEECSIQRCLSSHIIREDSNRNMYVHGVSEIEIKSVQEALEIFQIGQKNKKIGHNGLNAESSRSHSVFNIRLVQAPIGQHDRENRQIIRVSQLSLVDLAGSERSCRTNNTGARLRETGNINNSLMTLRSCFEYLRENQQAMSGVPMKKIPYRDSKITHLFKNFFEGEGQVSMIACINPGMEDYTENSQVMKFAEVTQEVHISRASMVQLSSNEDEITNLLRTKFNGYELEVPPGDGHLSEKLIYMLQKYLSNSKKESNKHECQAETYRQRIKELEKQNKEVFLMLSENRVQCKRLSERNQLLENAVTSNRESLAILSLRVADQAARLDAAEESLKNAIAQREAREISRRKILHARTVEELMELVPRNPPQKINFDILHKYIELVERDELA